MTITPALSLYSSLAVQPTNNLTSLLATTAAQDAGGLYGNSTVVELSGLGQLLSAAAVFQNNLASLHPGSTDSGLGQNYGTDFASLAAEAQNLVDNFNALQGTLTGLQSSGLLTGNALAAQFSQSLDTAATGTIAGGGTGPATLADIGITQQSATGTLSVDLQALQSAYQADPSATFSLLAQAAQSLGTVASDFTRQAGAETATLNGLGSSGDLSLLLGAGSTSNNFLGFADLLALSSLTSGNSSTLTRQLLALNEFNLVSTLTG
jgi:Flagellar hook-associated protein 2 C-terminus